MTRKRPGQKVTKKSTSAEGTTRSTRNGTPPPVRNAVGRAAMSSSGPSSEPFAGFSYTRPTNIIQDTNDTGFGKLPNPRQVSQAHLRPKTKPKTSVKSMKSMARGMGAATLQTQPNNFTAEPPSSSNHGFVDQRAFNFMALAKPEMGNTFNGEISKNPRDLRDEGVEASGSFQKFGTVQSPTVEDAEAHPPSHEDERRAKPPATHGSSLGFGTKTVEDRTTLNISGDGDGCLQIRTDSLAENGSSRRDVDEDKMEFEVESGDQAVA